VPGHRSRRAAVARHGLLVASTLILSVALAGCGGSQLDPGYALSANAALEGRPAAAAPEAQTSTSVATPTTPSAVPTTDAVSGSDGAGTEATKAHHHTVAVGTSKPAAGRPSNCAGFRNQTGITDTTVTLANISDISGPVPGIFTSAQQATRAYVAYFNATSNLCGRKLQVLTLDSRTDASGDLVGYTKACDSAFAAVGSMSAFDAGGAAEAQGCGLPDVRTAAVSDARNACTTCFGVQATDLHAFQNAVPDFLLENYADASRHAAMVYVNEAAAVENAKVMQEAGEKRGMTFVYSSPFDVAEFNYTPYVQQMKDKGVRIVQFVGSSDQAVRLARAMQGAGFHPDVFLLDPTAYDPAFVRGGGSAVEGATVFVDFTPLEEASGNAELQLYMRWLQQVSPGAVPSYFGMFAWSATRLFVEQAVALGGNLTRASLVARMRQVHDWTDNGLHAPQDVGGKTNSNCWRFLRLQGGHWTPAGGSRYLCHGETSTG
jgi:ABC-type branched-subunit amino acid transport system substrate-binding protein